MNATAILSSDMLDIIFENRNKAYGAYILRKEYNSRLAKALLAVTGLILMFSIYMLLPKANPAIHGSIGPVIEFSTATKNPETKLKEPEIKPKDNKQAVVKGSTPVIVPDRNADSLIATNAELIQFKIGTETVRGDTLTGVHVPGDGPGNPVETIEPEIVVPAIDKTKPIDNPEVEPLYPGGMKAFVQYLERNLRSPEDIDAGNTVSVKVRFVVNYDGTLKSFSVIQTGGQTFDEEVLRVLKKMPKWIPGQTRGEAVSVYYSIPVKFTTPE
ncbi:MAG: TonB family protein [Chitinophagaceae bacterium]